MGQKGFHNYIVPGLDVLISDPSFLTPSKNTKLKAKTLVIPSFYIYRVLDFCKEQNTRGESAKELTTIFGIISERMNSQKSETYVLENGMELVFRDFPENPVFRGLPRESSEKYTSSRFHAIAIAKVLQDKLGRDEVAIMTGSDQLATPAAFNGIDIARVNPDVYTGRIRVNFPEDYASYWWSRHAIPKDIWSEIFPDKPLVINQYVELIFSQAGQVDSTFQNVGRFDGENIVPLRSTRINNPMFSRIRPKTPGQAMLFDALLAPVDELPIVVISGTFGTGKTFCTVATGLAQVMDKDYEQVFVCPRDGALGKEIGFLKGDKLDKIMPQAAPITDNLGSVLRLMDQMKNKRSDANKEKEVPLKTLVDEFEKKYFEFEPVIYMGGRSIENSFMIYDEFQDMERGQARALLSRIGNNSKIVILGDPNQTTNPHLNKTSNGLSYIASKMAGDSLVAVVTFDKTREVVRSKAAKHIAERMSH